MAAVLDSSTDVEQRSVIRFLWAKGTNSVDIHRELTAVYGEASAFSKTTVQRWWTEFKDGRTSIVDKERSGRPRSASTAANIAAVDTAIKENRRLTVKELAAMLDISYGTTFDIIHEELKYRKTASRWVPKLLTLDQKQLRMGYSLTHLLRYADEGEAFLERIITGDETWVHHFTPESKQQSMVWKHTQSPPPKKAKTTQSAGKVMATVFWDRHGVIMCEFMPKGTTINAQSYQRTLGKLRTAIRRKRPDLPLDDVIILHDNARPHVANIIGALVAKWKWEILLHPPYSPDLAPSDYHLFGPLKKTLAGTHFRTADDVQREVLHWLRGQPNEFYDRGIQKLVTRWDRCINRNGDYVEK